jgi:hypothetical protein
VHKRLQEQVLDVEDTERDNHGPQKVHISQDMCRITRSSFCVCVAYFQDSLMDYLPRLVSNLDPPDRCLLGS